MNNCLAWCSKEASLVILADKHFHHTQHTESRIQKIHVHFMELHIEFISKQNFSRMHNTIKVQDHFVGGDHVIVTLELI